MRTLRHNLKQERFGVDLGHEPALSLNGLEHAPRDKLQFSLRWLTGTVITALAGTTLMGGALLAAVEGTTRFASAPSPALLRDFISSSTTNPASRKGDRLPPRIEIVQTRRIVQIATALRQGERDIIRTKPFARVSAPLSLHKGAANNAIPIFNPTRIFAEAGQPTRFVPTPADDGNAEMVVSGRSLSEALGALAEEDQFSDQQIHALVQRTLLARDGLNTTAAPPLARRSVVAEVLNGEPLLALRSSNLRDAFGDDRSRVIPQNVTAIEKRQDARVVAGGAAPAAPSDEVIYTVRKGETLASILVDFGVSLQESRQIIEQISKRFRPTDLKEGHRLRLATTSAGVENQRKTITRLAILQDRRVLGAIALTDLGQYAAIDISIEALEETVANVAEEEDEDETENQVGRTPTLFEAIYETALANNIPRQLIDELIKIYAYDVDFQRRAKQGDSIDVFYAAEEETGGSPSRDDILYSSLTVNGETKRYFKFRASDETLVDFYDERGRSSKKFLLRTPVNGASLRSGYGFRRHPILGYSRLHTGVDWAARYGSPVASAGAGTVIKAEWTAGYGRRVEVQHSNGYVTAYSHLSAFARYVQRGSLVTQGQIIGFLGSSGLSTGPHLHYEVIVNGSFVDPLRIRVPRGRVLDGRTLGEFEAERQRVEQMMKKADPAQLARFSN